MAIAKPSGDFIVLTVGKVIQVLIALGSIRLLTELLSESEIGNYYLLLSLLMLFSFGFLNPLGQYYGRRIIDWQRRDYLSSATVVLLVLRTIGILLATISAYVVYAVLGYEEYYELSIFIPFILISLAAGTHGVLLSAINTLGCRREFVKYTVLTLLAGLGLSWSFVTLWEASAIAWLYGVALSQILMLVPIYREVMRRDHISSSKVKKAFTWSRAKRLLFFILPISFVLFLQWGQATGYRFIVEKEYSLELLAEIAVGLSVASALFKTLETLAMQYFTPIYLRQIASATKAERALAWNEMANHIIPVYIVAAIFVICLSPYLLQLLVSENFSDVYAYTAFGAVIELFRSGSNVVYMVSQSELSTGKTVLPYGLGLIFTIAGLFAYDYSSSLWGIPLVLCISSGLVFFSLYWYMRQLLHIRIAFSNVVASVVIAIPFSLSFFFDEALSFIGSIIALSIAGLYGVFCMFVVAKLRFELSPAD